jgi:hypothetical protein
MIHNIEIYHCQCCGAMRRQEPERPIPECCGKPMTKAAEDTVQEEDDRKRGPQRECPCSQADPRRPR